MILATMVYIQWNPDERGEDLSDSNCTLIFNMVTAHKMFVIPILNSIYTTLDFRKKNRIEIKKYNSSIIMKIINKQEQAPLSNTVY